MQVGEGGLAAVRQVGVVEDEVEDHPDQVDHIGFLLGQPVLAGMRAAGLQLAMQLGFQLVYRLREAQAFCQVQGRFLLQLVEGIQ
ncbi:hypothetical protein D9M71_378390 [compost metagenome]